MFEKVYLFMDLGVIHTPTKVHTCRWNALQGLFYKNFVGGAIAILPHQFLTPLSYYTFCCEQCVCTFSWVFVYTRGVKMWKGIRGRYWAHLSRPSPKKPPVKILISLHIGTRFCEFEIIVKKKAMGWCRVLNQGYRLAAHYLNSYIWNESLYHSHWHH